MEGAVLKNAQLQLKLSEMQVVDGEMGSEVKEGNGRLRQESKGLMGKKIQFSQ